MAAEVAGARGLLIASLLQLGPGEQRATAVVERAHVLLLARGEQSLQLRHLLTRLRHLRARELELAPLGRAAQLALGHTLLLHEKRREQL